MAKNHSTIWPKIVRPFGQESFRRLAEMLCLHSVVNVLFDDGDVGYPAYAVHREDAAESYCDFGEQSRNEYAAAVEHCSEGLLYKGLRINHNSQIMSKFAQ